MPASQMPAAPVPAERIAANVAAVRAEMAAACSRAGRKPTDVTLVAVTKNQTPEVLAPLVAAGVTDVGENRADHQALMHASAPAGLHFHAIGRVQGRQFSALVPISDCLHSLAELGHVERLARACAVAGRCLPVFVQVNTSGEASKAGLTPDALPAMLEAIARHPAELAVQGLMTMAPIEDPATQHDRDAIRRCFAALRELAQRHGLSGLSMGMSQDFGIAIEEGATVVRIGTRLFR
jgi:pyridoxal phosphate enzyme (YggS family)